jgi:hypothetical protein
MAKSPRSTNGSLPEQELLRLANVADVRTLLHVALPAGDPTRQLLMLIRRQGVATEGLQVTVLDGAVALSGNAENWFDRDLTERLAWTLPGVRAVTNCIALPPGAAEPEAGDGTAGWSLGRAHSTGRERSGCGANCERMLTTSWSLTWLKSS